MKILSFDAEVNGLLGPVFAIGAVVVNSAGEILAEFSGRCPIEGPEPIEFIVDLVKSLDEAGMEVTHTSAQDLRETFWSWLQDQKEGATVVADVGYPVETHLLLDCQLADVVRRQWIGPYPLHEVASVLLAAGVDPDINREEYSGVKGVKHHPVHDAKASALCVLKALRALGRI